MTTAPGQTRTPLGEVLAARMVALGFPTIEAFAQHIGLSTRPLREVLSGQKAVFRQETLAKMDAGWCLPPGTIGRAVAGGVKPDEVAAMPRPAAPVPVHEQSGGFVAQLAGELTVRGVMGVTPGGLREAAQVLSALATARAELGGHGPGDAARAVVTLTSVLSGTSPAGLWTAAKTLTAVGDLLDTSALTPAGEEALRLVDEMLNARPGLTSTDRAKLRSLAEQRLREPAPAVARGKAS